MFRRTHYACILGRRSFPETYFGWQCIDTVLRQHWNCIDSVLTLYWDWTCVRLCESVWACVTLYECVWVCVRLCGTVRLCEGPRLGSGYVGLVQEEHSVCCAPGLHRACVCAGGLDQAAATDLFQGGARSSGTDLVVHPTVLQQIASRTQWNTPECQKMHSEREWSNPWSVKWQIVIFF